MRVTSTDTAGANLRSTLDERAQEQLTSRLQPLLVDLLDLALIGKQLHWNVVGHNFRAVHEHLDELVDAYRTWSDQIAERLAAVGVAPDGRAQRIAGDSPADPAPASWVDEKQVVRLMAERVEAVATRARQHLDGLGELDLVSEGLLVDILQGLEMQLWMLSAQDTADR